MIATPTAVNVPLRTDEGDVIRIGNSRVTLESVIADFHRGVSPEEIAHHYSALSLSDVYLVVGYYLQNRAEVDASIAKGNLWRAVVRYAAATGDMDLFTRNLN